MTTRFKLKYREVYLLLFAFERNSYFCLSYNGIPFRVPNTLFELFKEGKIVEISGFIEHENEVTTQVCISYITFEQQVEITTLKARFLCQNAVTNTTYLSHELLK